MQRFIKPTFAVSHVAGLIDLLLVVLAIIIVPRGVAHNDYR